MAVPTKTYPAAAPDETETLRCVEFEYTHDGKPCQIHVCTSKRARVTLNPGGVGEDEFVALWAAAPTAAQLTAIFDAVPDLSDEERGVAVAAP